MRNTKPIFAVILCLSLICGTVLPVFAIDARLNHGVFASYGFGITESGYAEAAVDFSGNGTSYTSVTVETYIQKRSLGFIWTKIDNGEADKTWVDTSTDETGMFVHGIQLEDTGTYRAVFKITFSGTGAADDVIEDKVERTYG